MLSPPPRDALGAVEPHDHAGIQPEHGVIRRISEQQIVSDAAGNRRVSTIAFNPSSRQSGGGLSVDLEAEIEGAGLNAREFVTNPRFVGSVRFTAQQLRGEALQIGYDPLPPDNPYHGEVWGDFTKGKKKRLLQLAVWFVPIEGVELG